MSEGRSDFSSIGLDERGHARPCVAAFVTAGEEGVLSAQGDRTDGIFDRVCVHLEMAVSQEDLQPIPVAVDIGELLAKAGFGGDATALMGQPLAEGGDQRNGLCSTDDKELFGCLASDAGLDLGDPGDAAQALGGDLGTILLGDVVQLASRMRPALGQRQRLAADAPGFGQGVIPAYSSTCRMPSKPRRMPMA